MDCQVCFPYKVRMLCVWRNLGDISHFELFLNVCAVHTELCSWSQSIANNSALVYGARLTQAKIQELNYRNFATSNIHPWHCAILLSDYDLSWFMPTYLRSRNFQIFDEMEAAWKHVGGGFILSCAVVYYISKSLSITFHCYCYFCCTAETIFYYCFI